MAAAIIGGGLAGNAHYLALRSLGLPIAGALASNPARSRVVAERWGVAAYDSLAGLLRDDRVGFVHVCVPTAAHLKIAKAVAAAGKRLVIEKPLAGDLGEALQLRQAAQDAGIPVYIGFNRRFDEGVQILRRLVHDGEIGEPINVWGSYQQAFNAEPSSFDWRFDPALIGATRVVSEIGSHWFDLAEHVLGRELERLSAFFSFAGPREARTAEGSVTITPTSEDAFAALLAYGEVRGSVFGTELAHGSFDDIWLRIDGTRRSAWWQSRWPNQATLAHKLEGQRVIGDGSASGSFHAMLAEVYEIEPRSWRIGATVEEGVKNVATIDAVARSARAGEWVNVTSPLRMNAG